jgi:hypothetical protein
MHSYWQIQMISTYKDGPCMLFLPSALLVTSMLPSASSACEAI